MERRNPLAFYESHNHNAMPKWTVAASLKSDAHLVRVGVIEALTLEDATRIFTEQFKTYLLAEEQKKVVGAT
jgi:hypothetical protein